MNILFIHQNFPGQYKNLAVALARQGHKCVALTLRFKKPTDWNGVRILPYQVKRNSGQNIHPWMIDIETKVIRAEACYHAAVRLREAGFIPDIICAHPGWGESMFLKDVWPTARVGLYYELYHLSDSSNLHFDPEFAPPEDTTKSLRIRMKNLNNVIHYPVGDKGISPTEFQAATFPPAFRDRISVIHDGINTEIAKPDPDVVFRHDNAPALTRKDEVITFVNRNLEPYRGYHIFMRALPDILAQRPNAQVLIVGADGVSYGTKPSGDRTWKQIFIDEVRHRISDADWARVHYLDRIPYPTFLNLLQVSRVHIYLTYPFVLSWSLLEAMSSECAIIASDTAPVREAITDNKTGRLVDFFDIDGLVAQVNDLLNDQEAQQALGRAARKHVIQNYDLRTVCLPKQFDWVNDLYNMESGPVGD